MTGVSSGRFLLHVGVIWSFAVAKPLFDVLADDPAFFVARDMTSGEIVVFSALLAIVPPLALAAPPALLSRLSRGGGAALQLAIVAVGATAIVLQALQAAWAGPALPVLLLGAAAGAALAYAYARSEFLPSVMTVLAPAPLLFLALFCLTQPISDLVFPKSTGGERAEAVRSKPPVVMVVLDELPVASLLGRDGEVDGSRYPGFRELASQSTWYRHAASPAANTHLAVPALLSGNDRRGDHPPVVSEYPENLFTALDGHLRMHVNEAVTALCPDDVCPDRRAPAAERFAELAGDLAVVEARRLLPASLADDLPEVDEGFGHFLERSDGRTAEFEAFVEEVAARPEGFHFFHLAQLPHVPWRFLPDGRAYERGVDAVDFADGFGPYADQPAAVRHLWQRHLLQVGYADRLIRELIRRLRGADAWNEAVVVVLADHGAAFDAGRPRRKPEEETVGAIAGVPLFVKAPGQREARSVGRLTCITEVPAMVFRLLEAGPVPGERDCGPGVSVYGYGERERLAPERFISQIGAIVREQAALFGSGGGWDDVYRLGDRWGLIGRRVGSLPSSPPTGLSADLELGSEDRGFAAGEEEVDAMVQAVLAGDVEAGERIAVSMGGRVAAIGVVAEVNGARRLLAIVPPRALNRGELALHRIRAGSAARLEPIELTG